MVGTFLLLFNRSLKYGWNISIIWLEHFVLYGWNMVGYGWNIYGLGWCIYCGGCGVLPAAVEGPV